MTVETSPDWLPPGWTREFRFQKTGRRITQYVNLASGQRFFTKDDLIRYTKMESKQCEDKLPTLRKNMTSTANDQAVIYVDPSTGLRFQSEAEVLRFLGHAVSSKRNPEKKKRDARSRKKVVIEKSTDDDLPSGWTKEVKIRRNVYGIQRYAPHPEAKRKKVKHLANRQELDIGGETSDRSISPDLDMETFEKGQSNNDHAETELATSSTLQVRERNGSLENAITRNPDNAEKSSRRSSVACKASNRKQGKNCKVVSADYVLDLNAAVDETEKSSMELDLPQGLSNQLDQLEPKQVASGLEHVRPCQSEAIGSCVLEDKSPLQLNIHSDPEVAKQAYASTIKSHCVQMEKIIKPIEDGDILGKQPQKLETEKTSDSKSEVQPLFSSDQCLELTMKTLKGRVLHEEAANEDLVSTPASNVLQEKNLGKTRMESKRSNAETTNSSKFKKIKELDMPRRFSIPVDVLEHEQVGNEAKPCVLADKATRQLNVDPSAIPHQASPMTVNTVIDNISPHEVFGEQPLMSETQKDSDSNLEVQHLFCSDPCLEFAIKTLTGAIPLEDAISEGTVLTSIANVQQQKNLIETRTENSSCKKTLLNSVGYKKKDVGFQQGSSKQLVEHAPELVENHLSDEQVLDFAAGEIYDSKAIRYVDLTPVNPTVKSSQQLEIGLRTALEQQNFPYNTTLSHDESSRKSKEPHKNQTVPSQTNDENPRQPSTIPFGSSWSDWSNSFFESPFKILTSSRPAEDSFAFQRNFHQPFGRYGNSAPITGQSVQQQQFPLNPPSFSLPKSSTTGAKKSYRKGKKKLPAKEVKS